MIGITMIQKEKGGGLSGAFGGSGSISTFGVKTSHILEKLTWVLFVLFVCTTFGMAAYAARQGENNTETPVEVVEKETEVATVESVKKDGETEEAPATPKTPETPAK